MLRLICTTKLWWVSTDLLLIACVHRPPAVHNGTVYFVSGDLRLQALDSVTGTRRWEFPVRCSTFSVPVVLDGTLYVQSAGTLYAVDPDSGEDRWSFYAGDGMRIVPTAAAFNNGTVYVGVGQPRLSLGSKTDGWQLDALDAETGSLFWSIAAPNERMYTSPTVHGQRAYASIDCSFPGSAPCYTLVALGLPLKPPATTATTDTTTTTTATTTTRTHTTHTKRAKRTTTTTAHKDDNFIPIFVGVALGGTACVVGLICLAGHCCSNKAQPGYAAIAMEDMALDTVDDDGGDETTHSADSGVHVGGRPATGFCSGCGAEKRDSSVPFCSKCGERF